MPKLGQKGAKPVNYLLVSAAAWQPDTSVSPEDIGVERLKLGSPLSGGSVAKLFSGRFDARLIHKTTHLGKKLSRT